MDAKPTIYRGVQFASRLEARWAVFFHFHPLVDRWEYEPFTFTMVDQGWSYTPDFLIRYLQADYYLEVKPARVAKTYLEDLRRFAAGMDHPLLLGFGDFYHSTPMILEVGTGKKACDLTRFFLSADSPLKVSQGFRFDLAHPEPPFRSGHHQSWMDRFKK